MEDKRNNEAQRPHTRRNPKRYISLVSLLLWHKIAAVEYFVWHLGLRMWSGSETKFRVFTIFKKFNIQPSEGAFLFQTHHSM